MLGLLNKEKQVIQFGKIKKNFDINTLFNVKNTIDNKFDFKCDKKYYNTLEEGFVYVKYPYIIYKVSCKKIRQHHVGIDKKEKDYNYYINDCLFMYDMITSNFYIGNANGSIKLPFPILNIYKGINKITIQDVITVSFYKICIGQALKGINIFSKQEVLKSFPTIINTLLSAKSNIDLPFTGFLYNHFLNLSEIHKVFYRLSEIHKNFNVDEAKLWYQKNKELNVVIEMLLNDKDWNNNYKKLIDIKEDDNG